MPIPTTTQAKDGDTLAISLMKICMLLGGTPAAGDNAHRSARKIIEVLAAGVGIPEAPTNGQVYGRQNAGWVPVVGPWTAVPVAPGYTGGVSTVQARWIADPVNGIVVLKGTISGGASWDTASQAVATIPVGLRPTALRNLFVATGSTQLDGGSGLTIATNGVMTLYPAEYINQATAFFDGVTFALN